jgi:hypothetical protein
VRGRRRPSRRKEELRGRRGVRKLELSSRQGAPSGREERRSRRLTPRRARAGASSTSPSLSKGNEGRRRGGRGGRIRSSTAPEAALPQTAQARSACEQGREEAPSIRRRMKLPDESRPPLPAGRGREPAQLLYAESRGRVVPLLRIEGRWRRPGSAPSGGAPGRAELGKRGEEELRRGRPPVHGREQRSPAGQPGRKGGRRRRNQGRKRVTGEDGMSN